VGGWGGLGGGGGSGCGGGGEGGFGWGGGGAGGGGGGGGGGAVNWKPAIVENGCTNIKKKGKSKDREKRKSGGVNARWPKQELHRPEADRPVTKKNGATCH